MKTLLPVAALAVLSAGSGTQDVAAQVPAFPSSFRLQRVPTNGTTLSVRVGGSGPAVVLLHGYGETGDMWAPLAAALARDHTVIVPDLRGMGRSDIPTGGYDKKTQGADVSGVLDALHLTTTDLVTHDIGNMVGYAFAAQQPERVTRFALLDAPIPGIGPWEEILKSPLLWHFRFGGPDMERLVQGRERIYLDRFWNEFSADPKHFDEASRAHYAELYARPGAMRAGFAQFKAFDQDAVDNRAYLTKGMLPMPVLAVGGAASFGPTMAVVMRAAATNVREVVIPGAGHWLMEENPSATVDAVVAFLREPAVRAPASGTGAVMSPPAREVGRSLTASEIESLPKGGAGAGTSGVNGIRTTTLAGDPSLAGPYTIELRVPPHTSIAAHTHRDERSAVVVSGTWYFGYGEHADAARTRALGPGAFYTEPGNVAHFARTGDQPAVVYITGFGPTDTRYVETTAAGRP